MRVTDANIASRDARCEPHAWPRAAAALLLAACAAEPPPPPVTTPTPAAHLTGERRYDERCASCHGARGAGTPQGPPLVHRIYRPGHHADQAFRLAVARGVAAHHWRFGDMPPVPGVAPGEVDAIVAYVRWLQGEAGIR